MKEGWKIKRLGDICDIFSGGTPNSKTINYWNGNIPFVTLVDTKNKYVFSTIRSITDEGLKNSGAVLLPVETVLLSTRATIGEVAIAKVPLCTNQGYKNFVCDKEKLLPEFLYYGLISIKDYLLSLCKGAVYAEISKQGVSDLKLSIPPLSEQQRIINILDEAFAKTDTVKQNAERNLKNVKELFHITLSRFYNVKNGRVSKKLGDISSINYGYTAKSSSIQGEYKYLRITDIQNNNVEWNSVPFCECEKEDAKKYILKNGDIVFARTGATTGKSFLLKGNFPKSLFASYLIRLKINDKNQLLPDFIRYYFDTSEYWETINKGIVGAAQGGFNASKLSEMLIYIPSLEEQQQIVAKLNALSEKCKELENNYQQTIHDCDELKKAILAKAFNGEL